MATRRTSDRAFAKARTAVVKAQAKLMRDTRAAILEQLEQANAQITLAISQQPEDVTLWRLEALQREVRRAMDEFARDSSPIGGRAIESAWRTGTELIDEPLEAAGIQLQSVTAVNTRALDAMRNFMTDKIRDIGTAAVDKINTQLGLAILGAQGPFEAVQAVQRILGDETRARANVIVRTELNRAFSAAAQARLEESTKSGLPMRKQWRRSGKVHSRPEHDAADGQVQNAADPFLIHAKDGQHRLMYPGDPKAPPGQTINCGCTLLPLLPALYDDVIVYRNRARRPFTAQELRDNQAKRDFAERVPI
ncbi:MAG: phage minor head protein [Burkholderiaceae bacterium]